MISGLCSAYQALGQPQHLELALRAAGFIKSTMWNPEERVLYRSAYRGADDGKIHQLEPPIKGYALDILLFLKMLRTAVLAVRNTPLTNIPKGFSSEMSLEVA